MQRIGYAVTIGDGAYVRNWPSTTSVIIAELPVNQAVYVAGQIYVDGVAWHEVQYDGQQWGYIRADMLRMMSEPEVLSYLSQTEATEEPAPTAVATLSPLDPEGLSSYGYVSSSTVNFRTQPSMNSERIRQLKKYALCLVLGTETVNGKTWYKVSYDGKTGYISGDYFKQMTLTELESFLNSGNYQEGITANSGGNSSAGSSAGSSGGSSGSSGGSQGTAGALVSAEDQKVEAWVNPNSGIEVSYEPFDPFATVAPLNENDPANTEYLDSLVERMKAGSLTEEGLQTVLEVAYRDNTNASEVIRKATEYIHGKLESTETEAPTETPEAIPLETEAPEFPQEENTGSPVGWIIALVLLLAAGGGGYVWYANLQRKRKAAQAAARKRASQQARETKKTPGEAAGRPARPAGQSPKGTASRQAVSTPAGPKTGTYTERNGSGAVRPVSAEEKEAASVRKNYGSPIENPYARYTTDGEEDHAYTASFKPAEENQTRPAEGTRRRSRSERYHQDGQDSMK